MVTPQDVREAAAGLAGVAVRTPLRYVEPLGAYLKLENLQPVGAFKLRGAYTAIRRMGEDARRNGVITYSSGNHGQAVAYAAQFVGVRAVVVMPETAPAVKVAGVKRWGGEVVLAGRTSEDRQRAAEQIAARERLAIVPPFDHPDIVAGQATVGLEIAQALPDARTVVVPVGGGGLIAGVVTGLAAGGSRATVWGVDATVSLAYRVLSAMEVEVGYDLRRYSYTTNASPSDPIALPNFIDKYSAFWVNLAIIIDGPAPRGKKGSAPREDDDEES